MAITSTGATLEGAPNFREFGGVPTADGRRVVRGRLFRSDTIDRLGARDIERIEALGISLICDIRSPLERTEAPNRWREARGIAEIHIDTSAEMRHANEGMLEKLRPDPTPARAVAMMREIYRTMPQAFAGKLGGLVNHLLAPACHRVVIHCAAGKDRTGFVCALLLLALDVPREAVYRDFELSATPQRSARLRELARAPMQEAFGAPPHPELVDALLGVREEYLDIALDNLQANYGSVIGYLEQAAGLDSQKLVEFRRALLE
jgi:protein-tyrosine phosphatase